MSDGIDKRSPSYIKAICKPKNVARHVVSERSCLSCGFILMVYEKEAELA